MRIPWQAVVALSWLAVVAVVAVSLSGSSGPVERLGMMQAPVLAASPNGEEFELVPMMERTGPEFLSSNKQMQMLTCFGHCGADCQKYCQENYLSCTHNDPAQRGNYEKPSNYMEPGPDYYAPTGHYQSGGRAHGGPDHVNWCRATLERCKGHCQ